MQPVKKNLLLVSRSRPNLPLEELCLKGKAAHFDRELLVFSRKEAERLFEIHGCQDKQAAVTAWNFSEGWPAALRMSLHSYLSTGIIEPRNNVEQLISETLFFNNSEKMQRMLLQLSVLGIFTLEEASLLCEDASAPDALRNMMHGNSFLTYDQSLDSYRFHSILQSYLLARLEENVLPVCRSIDRKKLYRRAGECVSQRGDLLQAIRHFKQAGEQQDLARILHFFELPGKDIFVTFDPEGIKNIVDQIPWEIRCLCPIGYLGFIHQYMIRIDRKQGIQMLEEAERYFSGQSCFSPDTRNHIAGEIQMVSSMKYFNDITKMYTCYKKASSLLKDHSRLIFYDTSWTLACPHRAFLYLRATDSYKDLIQFVKENIIHFQRVTDAGAGAGDSGVAEYYLETGQILAAQLPCSRAMAAIRQTSQLTSIVSTSFIKARLHLALGQAEAAWQVMNENLPLIREAGNPPLEFTYELCRAYIASIVNQRENIPSWLLSGTSASPWLSDSSNLFRDVVCGKALVTAGEWSGLDALAEKITGQIEALDISFGRIHLFIFKAIAAMHTGNPQRALEAYTHAIRAAKEKAIITSVAEYGRHLHSVNRLALRLAPEDRYLIILGKLIRKYAKLSKDEGMLLTLRERDIIHMVVTGKSNREIGEYIGLSQGSVANNLGRIYAKLGARNRMEAVSIWNAYAIHAVCEEDPDDKS